MPKGQTTHDFQSSECCFRGFFLFLISFQSIEIPVYALKERTLSSAGEKVQMLIVALPMGQKATGMAILIGTVMKKKNSPAHAPMNY